MWPCARPPLLQVQPPRNWITIWIWRESINRMPLQSLCSGIDFLQIPLEQVNSADVDSKSAAVKGSLGDTTFHPSSALALLIVRTMRNLPSKVYHNVAGRLENGVSPSAPTTQASLERRGVPSTLSDAGSIAAFQHVFFENCLRRCRESHCLQSHLED